MIFISKYKRHRITFKGARHVDINGEKQYIAGLQAAFMDSRLETFDEELITALKNHAMYGVEFWSEGQNEPNKEGLAIKQAEQNQADALVHSCPKCAFKGKNYQSLQQHIRMKHSSNE